MTEPNACPSHWRDDPKVQMQMRELLFNGQILWAKPFDVKGALDALCDAAVDAARALPSAWRQDVDVQELRSDLNYITGLNSLHTRDCAAAWEEPEPCDCKAEKLLDALCDAVWAASGVTATT